MNSNDATQPMLYPVRMKKLRALILDDYVEPVLASLQVNSSMHLVNPHEKAAVWGEPLEPIDVSNEEKHWQTLFVRVERIILDLNLKEELGLLDQLFKPREHPIIEVTLEDDSDILDKAEKLVSEIEREAQERITRYRAVRAFIRELRNTPITLTALRSGGELLVGIGRISSENLPRLIDKLQSRVRLASTFSQEEGRMRFIVVLSLQSFSEEIERIFEEENVEAIHLPEGITGNPSQALRWIDEQVNQILRKYERLTLHLYDATKSKLARVETMSKLAKAGRIVLLEGWVPSDLADLSCSTIEEASNNLATVLVESPDEPPPNIPTLLRDRRLIGHFRSLVEMYDVPAYNEVDPTPFLSFFFVLFFGLMSADIAVGLTMMLGAWMILRGAGTRSKGMRDLGVILLLGSVSTTIFGFLGGEFLGGLINLPVLWINSAEQPIEFMIIALVIGVINIVSGIVIGIKNNVSNGRYQRLVGDQLSVLALIAGACVLVVTGKYDFEGVGILGYSMIMGGIAMLLAVQKLTGLLQITSLLSNVISHVRIMAINMSSAWMLRTFLLVAEMLRSIELIGPLVSAVLLIFAHLFIVFIFSFSTFAHSLRLIYVEFFGRFFGGGGRRFNPIPSDRTFTSVRLVRET